MQPDDSQALREAIAHHVAGRVDDALGAYRALLQRDPHNAKAAHPYGVLLLQVGQLEEAARWLGVAVERSPGWPEAQNNLGVALRQLGRYKEAAEAFGAAARDRPGLYDAHFNLAEVYLDLERWDDAHAAARVAHRLSPQQFGPLLVMGMVHIQRSEFASAVERLEAALALEPEHVRGAALLRIARSRIVDAWHFAMLNDVPRNDAYEEALRRAIKPGDVVLEIGTGAGLLSLMSVRAGASHVYTCEMVTPVARKAREVVARNGMAEKITVLEKRSDEVEVGKDLPARARILVSELFDSNVLGEGVLPSLEDAHARLLEPGATIIPRAASAMVELAGGLSLERVVRVGKCSGFDLSPLNDFSPERIIFDGTHVEYERYSEPFEALRFDFREARHAPKEQEISIPVTRSGLCLGVVQWLRIEVDEAARYENRPFLTEPNLTPWLHALYTFERPVQVQAGQTLRLFVGHGYQTMYFRLARTW